MNNMDSIKIRIKLQKQTNLVNETELQYSEAAAAKAASASFDVSDDQNKSDMTCSLDNPEDCEACGS